VEVKKNYGYDDLPTNEPSSTGRNSTLQSPNNFEDTETLEKSCVESGMELSYRTLKGGFRNKGCTQPPYIKNTSDDVSTSVGNISIQSERLCAVRISTSFDAPVQDKYTSESRGNRNVGLKAHNKSSDSDSYDLVADSQHELHIQNE
jgi:hypothetical protein